MVDIQIPLPVVIAKEGKWFVASCPPLDIATQGITEQEVRENMKDLIDEYFRDPDTVKPDIGSVMSVSLTNIPIDIPEGVFRRKTSTASTE
ncbi:MAG: hypothetical protein A2Z88_00100 [Omnitrophica WOR_2 bacterium GWA2_47_8]|nr:MAG: hypothetical protein A2Z88_00100 [Omnitrophica WOR_2 bacterium GWA2_47_8]